MTKKKVWLYTCGFCRKKGRHAGHMARHEKSCTANPSRVCRMHHNFSRPQEPIPTLIATLGRPPGYGIDSLRELTDGCPNCMLAAIRQSGIGKWSRIEGDPLPEIPFNYQAELKSAWDEINARNAD